MDHRLPPRQGVETKREVKEGEVAVPLALRAVVVLPVERQSTVEGLVDPPKDRDQGALLIGSVESILASEATREPKVAHVRDTFRVNATRGDVEENTRALVSFTSVKVTVLKGISATMLMFRSPKSREGISRRGNILLTKSNLPTLGLSRVVNVVTHHIKIRVEKDM